MTSLPVEREVYQRFVELLPKGVVVADEVNKFIEERVQELEREKNGEGSIVVESSPIKAVDYNQFSPKAYNTTLDEFIKVYEDDTRRCKNFYYMDQRELYSTGQQISNILDEICCILSERYKVHFAFGRRPDYSKKLRIKSLVYSSKDMN